MKTFLWDKEKNIWLKKNRGISFEAVVAAIQNEKILDIIKHPNTLKYPNQAVIYVEIENYVYTIPCVENKTHVFLKTAYANRKATKHYLRNL